MLAGATSGGKGEALCSASGSALRWGTACRAWRAPGLGGSPARQPLLQNGSGCGLLGAGHPSALGGVSCLSLLQPFQPFMTKSPLDSSLLVTSEGLLSSGLDMGTLTILLLLDIGVVSNYLLL